MNKSGPSAFVPENITRIVDMKPIVETVHSDSFNVLSGRNEQRGSRVEREAFKGFGELFWRIEYCHGIIIFKLHFRMINYL